MILEEELATRRAKQKASGFIAVDLDGTLAEYHGWEAWNIIGPPIPAMVARVKQWLAEGYTVKVFTARLPYDQNPYAVTKCWVTSYEYTRNQMMHTIERWTQQAIGTRLQAINVKCSSMIELWDDRAIQVVPNTGQSLAEVHLAELTALKGAP